jgi:hypothetical protein
MVNKAARRLVKGLNFALMPLGVQVVRSFNASDPEQFLPFDQTISGAHNAGLSVADYVDVTYNVAGATQGTIDQMAALGVFSSPLKVVAEIGPGSGRYLEKVLRVSSPSRYEIYETAKPWAEYLRRNYKEVVSQPTDRRSMKSTPSATVDLVQAHKVFVVTTFLTTCGYWLEMIRVTRPGAFIVFDIVTENCMDPPMLDRWLATMDDHGGYPAIMPRAFAADFFVKRGIKFIGSFFVPMKPGKTETFVFRKAEVR